MFLKGNCQVFRAVRRQVSMSDQDSTAAKDKIKTVQKAFVRLQQDYSEIKKIHLSNDGSSLSVELPDQSFGLRYSPEQKTLVYSSPITGEFSYRYDRTNERFQNTKDQHILDEILVREQ